MVALTRICLRSRATAVGYRCHALAAVVLEHDQITRERRAGSREVHVDKSDDLVGSCVLNSRCLNSVWSVENLVND